MSLLAFVKRGSIQSAFIPARDLVHEACRVRFRQVTQIDRSIDEERVKEKYRSDKPAEAEDMIAEIIADRIESWTFFDKHGNELDAPEPTKEMVILAKGPLQDELVLIVYHQSSGGKRDPFAKDSNDNDDEPKSAAENVADSLKN